MTLYVSKTVGLGGSSLPTERLRIRIASPAPIHRYWQVAAHPSLAGRVPQMTTCPDTPWLLPNNPDPGRKQLLRKEQPDTRFLSTGYVSSQSAGLEEGARCRAEYRKIDTKPALTPVNCPPPKGTPSGTQGERLVGRLRYGPVHTRRPHSVGQPSPSVVTGPVPATPAATLFCIVTSHHITSRTKCIKDRIGKCPV